MANMITLQVTINVDLDEMALAGKLTEAGEDKAKRVVARIDHLLGKAGQDLGNVGDVYTKQIQQVLEEEGL